jgi:hypothetical protein
MPPLAPHGIHSGKIYAKDLTMEKSEELTTLSSGVYQPCLSFVEAEAVLWQAFA